MKPLRFAVLASLVLVTASAVAGNNCTMVHCDIDGTMELQEECQTNSYTSHQVCKFGHYFIDEHGRKIHHFQWVDCGSPY